MYESFFNFSHRPFSAAPDPGLYYPASAVERARLTLTRCIERGAGPGLLIAPAGLGKTLLCQMLADQFEKRFSIALLASTRLCTRRALLQAILFELGLPFRDLEEGELRLSLIDHVAPSKGGVEGMLLLVDEAHTLPLRLLDEIRMITNLVRDGQLRVRVVLAGNGTLEERFGTSKLESFNQRIAARCYLEPLTRDETFAFVSSQLTTVGADPAGIFCEDSLAAIHRVTEGIPRLVNQLADHALLMAAAGGRHHIDAAGIEEAWCDLQQLPATLPCKPSAGEGGDAGDVIEFGSLGEDEQEDPLAEDPESVVEIGTPSDPSQDLDEIQQQVAAVQDDSFETQSSSSVAGNTEQFDPCDEVRPDVELVFHEAEDPFAEQFEEEEVVVPRTIPFADTPTRSAENHAVEDESTVAADEVSEEPEPEGLLAEEAHLPEPEEAGIAVTEDGATQPDPQPSELQSEPVVVGDEQSYAPDNLDCQPGTVEGTSEDAEAEPRLDADCVELVEAACGGVQFHASAAESHGTAAMDVTAPVGAAIVCPTPLESWSESTSDQVVLPAAGELPNVEGRCTGGESGASLVRPRRRDEYRRLFAQLRRRKA